MYGSIIYLLIKLCCKSTVLLLSMSNLKMHTDAWQTLLLTFFAVRARAGDCNRYLGRSVVATRHSIRWCYGHRLR